MEVNTPTIRPRVRFQPSRDRLGGGVRAGDALARRRPPGEGESPAPLFVPKLSSPRQDIHSPSAGPPSSELTPWDGVMDARILAIHDRAVTAAADCGGALSRRRLRELGITRDEVRLHLRHRRWAAHGRWTIAMHTGGLSEQARGWRAVWEVGERIAVLDGPSALQQSGLQRWHDDVVHVSVPHTARVEQVEGVVVHKVRSRPAQLLLPGDLPSCVLLRPPSGPLTGRCPTGRRRSSW